MSEDFDPFEDVYQQLKSFNERLIRCEERLNMLVDAPKIAPTTTVSKPSKIVIRDLKEGDEQLTLTATIANITPIRTGARRDGTGDWTNITLFVGDHTGQIPLQLWDDDVEKYKHLRVDDEIIVTGAYIKTYQNKRQMRISKNGGIEPKEQHIL